MAEKHGSSDGDGGGGGSSGGFILLFFGGIFVLWFVSQSNGGVGVFSDLASSTSMASSTSENMEVISSDSSFPTEDTPTPTLTPAQVENQISDAYHEVDQLKRDAEQAKIWGTVSPYKDQVYLQQSNTSDTDPDSEYITLSVAAGITAPISISGWTIQSYVTGLSATLPQGTRLPKNKSVGNIALEAGESVFLITGESPIGVSFHENICTGYFAEFQTFSPPLEWQCPSPLEEMRVFGGIEVTDDSCYTFVGQQSSCQTVPSTRGANLSSACVAFVQQDLTYQGCVANHQYDPHFYTGSWRIYLSREKELWRMEREVIRLIDAEGRTVSVLEY